MFIVQDLMRKHRRVLLWIILILIVGPFVLWGGSFGAGSGGDNSLAGDGIIVGTGESVITADEFRDAMYQERARMAQFGQEPTFEQLLANGTALRVLESLVSRQLLIQQAHAQGMDFNQEYLTERMKEMPEFRNEKGEFNASAWNSIIEQGGVNWNAIYANLREQVGQQLYVERLMASARVLESDLKKQFEQENTKYSLRYVKVQPKVEPTEEQIQKTYNDNPAAFSLPEKRQADFVAVSVEAPKPALADELVQRARAGEDFAELAKQNSLGDTKDNGGDIGWVVEGFTLPEHQRPLFAMKPDEISEPVKGPAGYYIYKVEEERTSEISGQRDVKAREIVLRATLDPEELKARHEKANQLAAKAKETGDLAAAAAEFGLQVQHSGEFSVNSLTLEGIPADDARVFRATLANVALNEMSDVVTAPANLYVAKVTSFVPSEVQPLDAVREDVIQRTIADARRSPEYAGQVAQLIEDIQAKVHSVDQIPTEFPDLGATIEALTDFSMKDFRFGSGPPWDPRAVIAAVGDKEPGVMAGPVQDFLGETYFVEVVSRTPPDEKAWAEEWPEAQKTLRQMNENMQRQARLDDRLREMREQSPYPVDQEAFMQALGMNDPAEAPAEGAEETTESAPEAASDAAPDETAPAGETAPAAPEATAPVAPAATPVPAESAPAAETAPAAPAEATTPAAQ
ncbi:MAG: SurA N-terminal domain-containing protein [Candidatus Hydrogenedentes bacterium]|nr:SurA N-terminal domain-containing protein [Candidatus Hydrogenedentota bacterium]